MHLPTSRRIVLKAGAALGAGLALPHAVIAAGDDATEATAEFERVRSALVGGFSADGFREIEPQPIVTGNDGFNGGLRYDDSHSGIRANTMLVQPCARVSDIAEKGRAGVLPMFHIFRCNLHASEGPDASLARALDFLDSLKGLETARLGFVSVPELERLRPLLVRAGVDWDRQVFLRDPKAAFEAGDGSGYFRHPGDDSLSEIRTVGVYYSTGRGPAKTGTYPLPASWIEIGEVSVDSEAHFGLGFGVERLALASSGTAPTWNSQLKRLFAQIDRDGGSGARPPGRAAFEKS